MNMKKMMIVSVVGGLLFSGAFILGVANAEDTAGTPPYQGQGKMGQYMQVYYHAQVAQILNLTEDALYEARQSGKSLVQIADEQGLERVTLENKLVEARKEALDKAVEDGTITQEQAEFMLENIKSRVSTMVEREDFGPNPGQGWGTKQGGQGGNGMKWNGKAAGNGNGFGRGFQQNN